ncbi:MAG: histone-fold-containing protein [Benniella sp.]|nr:MAG: histone-fold-containing protein [Benniella sp.]
MAHQRQSSSGSSYDPPAAAQYYQHQGHLHQQPQQQPQLQPQLQQQLQQQTHPQYYMPPMGQIPPPPPLQHHRDPPLSQQQPMHAAHAHMLQSFWMNQMHEVENVPQDYKLHHLPLARIKKVMKTDEDVKAKMISAEAPLIFDKACEVFITELTIRAWIHAEENKRRTLQRSDIAAAITKTDMFDFLIDIVPREDHKTAKEPKAQQVTVATAAVTGSEPRRSQESFPPVPTSSSGVSPGGPFEGYGYPYGVIENGSFAMVCWNYKCELQAPFRSDYTDC